MSLIEATSPTSTTTTTTTSTTTTTTSTNRSPQRTADNDEVTDIVRNENGESKSREVSPKLVVGGKKYGRRSRPQSAVAFDSSPSESDDDQSGYDRNGTAADKVRSKRVSKEGIGYVVGRFFTFFFLFHSTSIVLCLSIRWKSSRSMRCRCQVNGSQQTHTVSNCGIFLLFLKVQRSASQSDMHGTTNVRRIRAPNAGTGGGGGGGGIGVGSANSGTKLKRCASLPAQKQRHTIIAANNETRNLKTQLESSVESLGE